MFPFSFLRQVHQPLSSVINLTRHSRSLVAVGSTARRWKYVQPTPLLAVYSCEAFSGRSSNLRTPVSSDHPGSSSCVGTTFKLFQTSWMSGRFFGHQIIGYIRSCIQTTQGIDGVNWKIGDPWRSATMAHNNKSNEPTRRGRPVVGHHTRRHFTYGLYFIEALSGNGPSPTTCMTFYKHPAVNLARTTPEPIVTPPATGLEEVTNG